jgi:hypothetical protein
MVSACGVLALRTGLPPRPRLAVVTAVSVGWNGEKLPWLQRVSP